MNKIKKIILGVVVVVLVGAGVWGYQWATNSRLPLPEAVKALESDAQVAVTEGAWLAFSPTTETPKVGLILYPGGAVDPRGYAPLARAIASEGYLVVIPSMPVNMAAFKPDAADEIIAYYPEIEVWTIGGHSLGGAMAAQYTHEHREVIKGLALWASYPPESSDISDLDIPVVSIYGSRENLAVDGSLAARAHLLPEDTLYVSIEGGDHHQFGAYQIKPEEHLATTSRASQHEQIIQATLDMLAVVSNSK